MARKDGHGRHIPTRIAKTAEKRTRPATFREEMIMSGTLPFLYPPPQSMIANVATAVGLLSLANAGLSEVRGKHLQYSKFWNSGMADGDSVKKKKVVTIPSRRGMLLVYSPALVAAVASFLFVPGEGLRLLILKSCLTLHYLKRVLEVLFVHKYSGAMAVDAVMPITLSYFPSTVMMIHAQHLTKGLDGPAVDLQSFGVVLFLIGILGNLYHHVLLSKLRSVNAGKEYRIPKGGLFDKVICPHYLFEILDFWGIALVSQTPYGFSVALGTTLYLTGRSVATRRWYASKFEDFPKHIRILIPFLF